MKKLILIFLLFPSFAWAQSFVSVVDGDTLNVDGEKIRLFGIDAPEMKQSCNKTNGAEWYCGEYSKKVLINVLGLKEDNGYLSNIDCTNIDKDRYQRWVSVCFINGTNINREMVRRGAAFAYIQYSRSYLSEEDRARSEGIGIWEGKVMEPWEWRKTH